MGAPQAYVERTPLPSLARAVRTVWVQHTGPGLYVQRNLPTGGAEIQCRVGSVPRLVEYASTTAVELSDSPISTHERPGFHPLSPAARPTKDSPASNSRSI